MQQYFYTAEAFISHLSMDALALYFANLNMMCGFSSPYGLCSTLDQS